MLEIKVILHDATRGGEKREIGGMTISNIGEGPDGLYDYDVTSWRQPPLLRARALADGFVERHNRQDTVWELVRKACEALR